MDRGVKNTESPEAATIRRISIGRKKLDDLLNEWRQKGYYGEVGVSFLFDGGEVRTIKEVISKLEK